MNFFDLWVIRIVTRLILLHLCVCTGAVIGLIMIPLQVLEFLERTDEAKELLENGTEITLPLLRNADERFFVRQGYRYFTKYQGVVRYSHREKPTKDLKSLTFYQETLDEGLPRAIEVPKNPSVETVYQSMYGKTWTSALYTLIAMFLGWVVIAYIAVRGYFFIKGNRRSSYR